MRPYVRSATLQLTLRSCKQEVNFPNDPEQEQLTEAKTQDYRPAIVDNDTTSLKSQALSARYIFHKARFHYSINITVSLFFTTWEGIPTDPKPTPSRVTSAGDLWNHGEHHLAHFAGSGLRLVFASNS